VSTQQLGALYSSNDQIWLTTSSFDGTGPALEFKRNGSVTTRIGGGGKGSIVTGDIFLTDSWVGGWTLVDMLKDLYQKISMLGG